MIIQCTHCSKTFNKIPSQMKKSKNGNHFCSRSCAASYNNKTSPKRSRLHQCKLCDTLVKSGRTYCPDCRYAPPGQLGTYGRLVNWSTITLRQMKTPRKYQAHSRIRNLARAWYLKSDRPKYCVACGYNKHFHVGHIKAIDSFDLETLVTVINDPSNLIALCPNCHWEHDHGLLTLPQIRQQQRERETTPA